jgi:hypothetical protein
MKKIQGWERYLIFIRMNLTLYRRKNCAKNLQLQKFLCHEKLERVKSLSIAGGILSQDQPAFVQNWYSCSMNSGCVGRWIKTISGIENGHFPTKRTGWYS